MIKKSIFMLMFLLLLTGCAERSSIVTVPVVQHPQYKSIEKEDKTIPTLVLHNSREDELKETISGSLILIIGLILFL